MIKRGSIVYLKHSDDLMKRRPFVVVSNDIGNRFSDILIIVPLTSKIKRMEMRTHCVIDYNKSMVLAEQIYTIDQSEVDRIVRRLSRDEMRDVENCLLVSLGIGVDSNDRTISGICAD